MPVEKTLVPYVLDANIFIQSARKWYAFDIVPGFWNNLIRFAKNNEVISINKVLAELKKGKDDLSDWAQNEFKFAFQQDNNQVDVLESYRTIIKSVSSKTQYSIEAKEEFADDENADAWLIAYAKTHKSIIVTHENFDPKIKRKVPIPNVCREFDIEYIDTFEMLRKLNIKLN
jgi:hypothetical protein